MMRKIFIAFAALASVRADEEDLDSGESTGENVLTMTTSTFATHISKNKYVLAEFYAPWCGHCKALVPEYEKAATHFKSHKLPNGETVSLVKVDATEEKELAEKYEVRGYPTLIWFSNGSKSEYDGGRTSQTIIDWINDAVLPAVQDVDSIPEPTKRPVVALSGPERTGDFDKLADSNRKSATFVYKKSTGDAKIQITHSGEKTISAKLADVELDAWFSENSFPIFGHLDGETFAKYNARGLGFVWIMLKHEKDDYSDVVSSFRSEGEKIGKAFSQSFSVFHINTVEFADPIEGMLGVKEFPAVAVNLKPGDKKKFIYTGDMKAEKIIAWVNDVVSGKIESKLKSETVPAKNDGPVKVIVGSTLIDEVFKSDKDVMLEVYAPWCGHCKKFEPEYEKVGKQVIKDELSHDIVVAKMDGTLNDSPHEAISWSGFPTILYIKAGSDKPVAYDGPRDAKGMWKWIKANHSDPEIFKKKADKKDEL